MKTEQQEKSYRLPYQAPINSSWWRKLSFYMLYILRESTAFFMLWISIVLMYGVICAHTNEIGQDEFYRFIFFLQHPIVVILNSIALLSALFHTITWFNLAPKAINMVVNEKKPPAIIFITIQWLLFVFISAVIFLIVFGYFK